MVSDRVEKPIYRLADADATVFQSYTRGHYRQIFRLGCEHHKAKRNEIISYQKDFFYKNKIADLLSKTGNLLYSITDFTAGKAV